MYKKGVLLAILICTLSLSGCIVINTGKDDSDGDNSSTNKTVTKEVIIEHDNSTSDHNNSTKETSSNAYTVDGYIFYDSNSRYLTSSDLAGLSKWELRVARNEIYARHGRLFKDSNLQNYFNSCSWYNGYISPDRFNENTLNKVEVYNIKFIKKYE